MPTVYAVGGVSGSGKTYLRLSATALTRLAHFDITNTPGQQHAACDATSDVWLQDVERYIRSWPGKSVVCEAFFAPGQHQRREIECIAGDHGYDVRYIWCAAKRQICFDRIRHDYDIGKCGAIQYYARVNFINSVEDHLFLERPDEHLPPLLDGTCASCRNRPYEPPPCQECGDTTQAPMCIFCSRQFGHEFYCTSCGRRERRRRHRQRRQQDALGWGFGDGGGFTSCGSMHGSGRFSEPGDTYRGPEGAFGRPGGGYNGPEEGYNGPEEGYNGPGGDYGGPGRGYDGPVQGNGAPRRGGSGRPRGGDGRPGRGYGGRAHNSYGK